MDLPELAGVLLPWFWANRRELPWRADRDPYHVWVSEIMLQQTRVEAVKGYFTRFLAALPDIPSLASCDDDRLRKLWEGLGYYSRVRNLKKAAQQIVERHGGGFPDSYPEIRALPGIGDYTAGAICSICFEQPEPAVDGNVLRVITRLTACREPIDSPAFRRDVTDSLRRVYPACECGSFTQALMELGATVCLPNGEPCCPVCPLSALCRSRADALWKTIPVRRPKKPRRKELHTVLILRCEGKTAIRKRDRSGLLAELWEFPNLPGKLSPDEAVAAAEAMGCRPYELIKQTEKEHVFTHVEWELRGYYLNCRRMPEELTWAADEELDRVYSLPTAFRQFREPQ